MTRPPDESRRPVDHDARERARYDHATSLVLEAGAGTGKTTLLIDRIEALVRSGRARLLEIAAVTFTENAATTMKLRLRERLEAARVDAQAPAVERERAAAALDVLERAPISTIHALAAALLQERPIECGVSPGFRVADEAEADLVFAEAWDEWLAERLTRGDETLLGAIEAGIPIEAESAWGGRSSLRGLARMLVDQRDLQPLVAEVEPDPQQWRAELLERAARGLALAREAQEGDTLRSRLLLLAEWADRARFLEGPALVSHLMRLPTIQRNFGHKPRWPTTDALDAARAVAEWTSEVKQRWAAERSAALHGRLVTALAGVVSLYARKKAERGLLDFLDLLAKAEAALRSSDAVRRYFRRRFKHLVIDEFQDTDPLQVKIARLLEGDTPGGLVVVGDAKQSIYRFRRADVALFRQISEEAASGSGRAVLHLVQNFRSRPAILRFVNRVFERVIQASKEADQPAYEAIVPPPGLSDEPSVLALRFEARFAAGDDLLRAEAQALAALFAQVGRGAYEVRDPATGQPRKSRAGDVMVLARRLTKVGALEEALEAAGLRFTVEGGKSFFDRQEVHEVLSVLRAVEDPSDRVALVAALRSSLFGVSDRDIVTYVLAGGGLWLGPVEEALPGASALAPALQLLSELNAERTRLGVPALIERLFARTRILAALTGTRRGEAQIANLQKVQSLARQAGGLGVLTLRGFTRFLQDRIVSAREEPDLPTTRPGDPDTIRILSIHKAKGLESPLVALCDCADDFKPRTETVPIWETSQIAIGFRQGCQPPGWDALVRGDEAKAAAESRRLLYVACTRARDFLVVPRPPLDARSGDFWREVVSALPAASDADVRVIDAATLSLPEVEPRGADLKALAAAEGPDVLADRWDEAREQLVASASRREPLPVSALRVAARTAPPAAAVPGGAGRDFGSLVHRLLEWVPLEAATLERLEAMAQALAPALSLDAEAARRAAESAHRALALPVMERARRAKGVWRELPVWFADGEDLVEGVVDLVFEEEGGLVVVDYKTDHISEAQALDQAAHHAPQLRLYGRGLALATGLSVRERLVLFTSLARTVAVGLLAAAMAILPAGCTGPPSSSSQPPVPTIASLPAGVCGDGVVQGAEECDDRNTDEDDGCLSDCFRPVQWIAGDPHLHGHGCFGRMGPEELAYEAAKQRLRVASALVWGEGYLFDRPHFTGEDDPASTPNLILHYDLEVSRFPAAQAGHLVLLGLRSIDFSDRPLETPGSGVPVLEWAHAQGEGVVAGMAHGQFWPPDGSFPVPGVDCCMPYDLPVHVVRGQVSFLETEWAGRDMVVDHGTQLLQRTLLNSGFRLALAGGSDFPCLNAAGFTEQTARTDVIVAGALSYARWLDGIRQGRTAVVRGNNHLNLRLDGALLGSEVQIAQGDSMLATVETRFLEPQLVEILVDGVTATRLSVEAGSHVTTVRLQPGSSCWVAARSPVAMTSPIYVLVDGQPIRASKSDACYLIREVDHVTRLVHEQRFHLGASTTEALAAYAEARAELVRRFSEAGGQSCP